MRIDGISSSRDPCIVRSWTSNLIARRNSSGIGCSPKTTGIFLGNSAGFNSVRGRMLSGCKSGAVDGKRRFVSSWCSEPTVDCCFYRYRANRSMQSEKSLTCCSIVHQQWMLWIDHKGQDSATADRGSVNKSGVENSPQRHWIWFPLVWSWVAGFYGEKFQRW